MKIDDRVKIKIAFDGNHDHTYLNGYIGTIVEIINLNYGENQIGYVINTDIPFWLSSTRYFFKKEELELIEENKQE